MDDPNVAYGQTPAVAVEPAAMQVVALFIELLIAPPRATAARAIEPPIIARISAYSAAAAPDWSSIMFVKVFIFPTPFRRARPVRANSKATRAIRRRNKRKGS